MNNIDKFLSYDCDSVLTTYLSRNDLSAEEALAAASKEKEARFNLVSLSVCIERIPNWQLVPKIRELWKLTRITLKNEYNLQPPFHVAEPVKTPKRKIEEVEDDAGDSLIRQFKRLRVSPPNPVATQVKEESAGSGSVSTKGPIIKRVKSVKRKALTPVEKGPEPSQPIKELCTDPIPAQGIKRRGDEIDESEWRKNKRTRTD